MGHPFEKDGEKHSGIALGSRLTTDHCVRIGCGRHCEAVCMCVLLLCVCVCVYTNKLSLVAGLGFV